MHVGTALLSRENPHVHLLGQGTVRRQNDGSAWTAYRLVRRKRDHVRQSDRTCEHASCHQSCCVRNVGHEQRASPVSSLTQRLPINVPGIGAETGHDDLRPKLLGLLGNGIVVQFPVQTHVVMCDLVHAAGPVHRAAVGQVPAGHEGHAEDLVARLEKTLVHRIIRRSARQGLHVRVDAVRRHPIVRKQLGGPPPSERLDQVHVVGSFIVPSVRIAFKLGDRIVQAQKLLLVERLHPGGWVPFRIDVPEVRRQGHPHRNGTDALRSNEDELAGLPGPLGLNQLPQKRVCLTQPIHAHVEAVDRSRSIGLPFCSLQILPFGSHGSPSSREKFPVRKPGRSQDLLRRSSRLVCL